MFRIAALLSVAFADEGDLFVSLNGELEEAFKAEGADIIDSAHSSSRRLLGMAQGASVGIAKVRGRSLATMANNVASATRNHHKCGGFFVHKTEMEAKKFAGIVWVRNQFVAPEFTGEMSLARNMTDSLSASGILETVKTFTTKFHNRFYKGEHGVAASNWIAEKWRSYVADYPWASVRQVKTEFENAPEKTVVATLTGKSFPEKIIVIGAHFDSTRWAEAFRNGTTRQPAADDNASGTACVTHILRVLAALGTQPNATIEFYAYAAEEMGLHGSYEASKRHSAEGKKVVAAFNIDMAGYPKKNPTADMFWIDDYTDKGLTDYVKMLGSQYLPGIRHGRTSCGYACSDHASWYMQDYPTAFPFENENVDDNPNYHRVEDKWDTLNADSMVKYAQVGALFVAHLGYASSLPDHTRGLTPAAVFYILLFVVALALCALCWCCKKKKETNSFQKNVQMQHPLIMTSRNKEAESADCESQNAELEVDANEKAEAHVQPEPVTQAKARPRPRPQRRERPQQLPPEAEPHAEAQREREPQARAETKLEDGKNITSSKSKRKGKGKGKKSDQSSPRPHKALAE